MAAVSPVVLGATGPQVEDAGVILGENGEPGLAMSGWDSDEDGYAGSLSCAREVSAVSGACALIATATLERLGGFSELYATPRLAWLDLSLRAREAGTPQRRHAAGRSSGATGEPAAQRTSIRSTGGSCATPGRRAPAARPVPQPEFRPAPGGYGR